MTRVQDGTRRRQASDPVRCVGVCVACGARVPMLREEAPKRCPKGCGFSLRYVEERIAGSPARKRARRRWWDQVRERRLF